MKMSGDGDHARRQDECLQTGTSAPLKPALKPDIVFPDIVKSVAVVSVGLAISACVTSVVITFGVTTIHFSWSTTHALVVGLATRWLRL